MYIRTLIIHVYINAGPLPFKSQTIAYIMKRSAIYILKFNRNIHV